MKQWFNLHEEQLLHVFIMPLHHLYSLGPGKQVIKVGQLSLFGGFTPAFPQSI